MSYIAKHIAWLKSSLIYKFKDGKIAIAFLDKKATQHITEPHSKELAKCYIDLILLKEIAANNGVTIGKQLMEFLPDQSHIRTGDFGEILCRQALRNGDDQVSIPVYRWRNRTSKNALLPGTDIIGYIKKNAKTSVNDTLIICEVKTRSKAIKKDIVLEAYEGVKLDYASRMASSIYFCQKRLLEDGLKEEAKDLARFSSPHSKPFKKKLIAAVVHENTSWNDALLDVLPEKHGVKAEIEVFIVKVEELADWIDKVYEAAIKTVEK